jgi:hypothetical protein
VLRRAAAAAIAAPLKRGAICKMCMSRLKSVQWTGVAARA